uniref:Laccase 19 n=1 Tax=Salvia miltiorrhiza TaxID=226208 RepID=A0A4Y5RR88_SALMI|nr:laccase 19 [Salvia miltiorrhiza]
MFSNRKVFIMCFLGIMLGDMAPVHGLVHKFEVRRTSHTRLCTNKTLLTVNGQFPGPTIYARRGELVVVDVINHSHQNITIHWHGVKMQRYPWTDGVNYVTQCPISPGKRFRQQIVLSNEEGTLFWHAHSDWSRATVYGAIVILPPKTHTYPFPKPHAQVPILLGEWWNDDVEQVYKNFLAQGRNPKVSDAFLMNGQPGDLYPCSKQGGARIVALCAPSVLANVVRTVWGGAGDGGGLGGGELGIGEGQTRSGDLGEGPMGLGDGGGGGRRWRMVAAGGAGGWGKGGEVSIPVAISSIPAAKVVFPAPA